MLNQPVIIDTDPFDPIGTNLQHLVAELAKEGVHMDITNFKYSFIDRVESLYVYSELIYPDCDLPSNFGVQRGYNGGGMHSGLSRTEIHRLPKNRQAKAARILELFAKTFWNVLKDFDKITETSTGESVETWNSVTI